MSNMNTRRVFASTYRRRLEKEENVGKCTAIIIVGGILLIIIVIVAVLHL
jgi:hypothetical protein